MMKTRFIQILFLLALVSAGADIALAQSSSRWSHEKFIGPEGDTLQYRLLFPDYDTLRKYPLVVFLHGSGERGSDNEAQLKWGVGNFATDQAMAMYPALVIAPQCPPGQDWSNFSWNEQTRETVQQPLPSGPMELVIGLIRQMIGTMPVDTSRIYITGLSMGGFGTFDAIARYPQLFAAAVPVCGGGDISKAGTFAYLPVWIFHGSEDSGVDVHYSLDMAAALTRAGSVPGLTIYPGVGHFAWLAAYSDPLMMAWLFRQVKKPAVK
jgi:predicted peptidase